MEVLLVLIVLAAAVAVLAPVVRRRRLQKEGGSGLGNAVDPDGGHGFVPVADLDVRLPGADAELLDALDATSRAQDWNPVARLLAFTGDEWELRWQRVQSIAGAAAMELAQAGPAAQESHLSLSKTPDGRWLREWRTARPDDAGAAQVYAQFLVWRALADPTSEDHRIILEEARKVCHEAASLAPQDPTPHIVELGIARRLGYRAADFEALWSTVRRLAPHHMGAHLAALPYWSAQGSGSRDRADAFARAAAARAPEGTLLAALPLFALYEHLPEVNVVRGLYQGEEIRNAIEAAEFAVDQVEDGHPVRPHVLHLLVCFLVRAERYEEALAAIGVVDGYIGAVPWVDSSDPAHEYAAYRALAVAGHASAGRA